MVFLACQYACFDVMKLLVYWGGDTAASMRMNGHTNLMGAVLCHPRLNRIDRLECILASLMIVDYGYEEILATLDELEHTNVKRVAALVGAGADVSALLEVSSACTGAGAGTGAGTG